MESKAWLPPKLLPSPCCPLSFFSLGIPRDPCNSASPPRGECIWEQKAGEDVGPEGMTGGCLWADSNEASAKLLNPEAQMLKPLNGQGCNFYLKGWIRVGTEGQG